MIGSLIGGWIPVTGVAAVGKYRLVLKFSDPVFAKRNVPTLEPQDRTIEGKTLRISHGGFIDDDYVLSFELLDNPIPAMAIVVGLAFILGLTVAMLISVTLEKFSPGTSIALFAVLGVVLFGLYKWLSLRSS